jgi:hypothetical protein
MDVIHEVFLILFDDQIPNEIDTPWIGIMCGERMFWDFSVCLAWQWLLWPE